MENKETKTMHVQADIGKDDIDPNYKVKDSSVEPNSVKVTGGREQLKKIAYLKATYKEANKLSQDTSDVADVTAFDKSLNKLDVNIQPNQVKLNVKLQEYSKKVKVKINKKAVYLMVLAWMI